MQIKLKRDSLEECLPHVAKQKEQGKNSYTTWFCNLI
jgi:hypothetical protein